MKTRNQELVELRKKFNKQEEELEKKHDILDIIKEKIPNIEGYKEPFIHVYRLYGSTGTIKFGFSEYLSIKEGEYADKELFKQVIEAFPSIRKVKVKEHGCTGFRPDETLEEKEGMSLYDCYDKTVRITPPRRYGGDKLSTEWYTKIGYQIWDIQFDTKFHYQGLGDYKVIYDRSNSMLYTEDYTISSCSFTPKYNGQVLKYASADRKTPNDFIVYWDKNSGEKVNFPEIMFEKQKG